MRNGGLANATWELGGRVAPADQALRHATQHSLHALQGATVTMHGLRPEQKRCPLNHVLSFLCLD